MIRSETYSSCRVGESYSQDVHASDHCLQRADGVAVHHWSVLLAFISSKSITVDDSEEGGGREGGERKFAFPGHKLVQGVILVIKVWATLFSQTLSTN